MEDVEIRGFFFSFFFSFSQKIFILTTSQVALVVDDPTNVSPEMPADKKPKTFSLPQENQEAAMKPGSAF